MSLSISLVQTNFVISTSDTAITYFANTDKDIEFLKSIDIDAKIGEYFKTDGYVEKVFPLTDKVLLSSLGNHLLSRTFEVELANKLSKTDDLQTVRKVAQQTLNNILEMKIENFDSIIESVSKTLRLHDDESQSLEDDFYEILKRLLPKTKKPADLNRDFSIYIFGFNDDGTTGMVDIRADKYLPGPKDIESGYPLVLDGAAPGFSRDPDKYSDHQLALILPPEYRTVENFIKAITYVHGDISKNHPINVSTDCVFHILANVNSEIEYHKFTIDTSDIFAD